MNFAIVRKTLRDTVGLLTIMAVSIVLIEVLFVYMLGEVDEELTRIWQQLEFVRVMIRALLGANLLDDFTPTSLMSIGLAHPLIYAFCWTLLLTVCTRVLVGEVDRGTADLLLTLPVSRAAVYVSVSLVALLCATVASFAPLPGIWLGEKLRALSDPIDLHRLGLVAVNFFFLNIAIVALTMLVSSLASRRGLAVGIALGIVLASFLLSFLAQAWPVAERLSFIGLLHYYQPLPIVRGGSIPWNAPVALGLVTLVAWGGGLWHFRRRDIPAA